MTSTPKTALQIFGEIRQMAWVVPQGTFQVDWDGRSDAGDELAPGLYTYTITSGTDYRSTGKLMLTK